MVTKVLVVVDCQNDFFGGSLGTAEARAIEDRIAEKIRNWDGLIYVTQDSHDEGTYFETQEGKNLPVLHCVYGTEGWELTDKILSALINSRNGFIPTVKNTFGSTNLVERIRQLRKDEGSMCSYGEVYSMEIELVGVCTDICVVSNAIMLKNMMDDYTYITVDATCCAGVTPESHQAALTTMKMCQINVKEG